jgi:acyl-CoA synthetase (AMP-forming)/AMP-acid ligase II
MLSAGLTFASAVEARAEAGLVGPNAVIQLAAALRAAPDPAAAADVFERAGLTRMLASPPDAMIDESIPARLFAALWQVLPPEEAAVIAIHHPKWQERPPACVKLKAGEFATPETLQHFLAQRFSRWWVPDIIELVDEIPKTPTGKFKKEALRKRYA